MRFLIPLVIGLCLAAAILAAEASTPEVQQTAAGHWKGAIEVPTGPLEILVTLEAQDDKGWTGAIAIPAQGLRGFELSAVSVKDQKVHFEMDGIPGQPTFEGTLSETGDAIAGSFQQGPQSLSFSLERSDEAGAAEKAPPLALDAVPGEGMPGEWMGVLDIGPMNLRLILRAEARADGALSASIESVDQNTRIPVDKITLAEGTLNLVLNRINASYKGVMNQEGSALQGVWSQGGRTLPLTFHRLAEPFALARPQNPEGPFPYESQDVTFRNEGAEIDLAGTLVFPEGDGPFPTVLFVTGSGPQDRDETLMGHKPFLVIADHLARKGIASLRYDDRGAGKSEGDHMGSTVEDFASDVGAGIAYLSQQPKVDPKAIGILGHSEGGLSGPWAATKSDAGDFLVLLAPPGEALHELVKRQNRDHLERLGVDQALKDKVEVSQAQDFEILLDTTLTSEEASEKLQALAEAQMKEYSANERTLLQMNPEVVKQGIRQMTTPWFRSLIHQDPVTHLKATKIPTLALFGEKDVQVPPEFNAKLVEDALQKAGNEDYEVRTLANLNHLFQNAETGSVEEYNIIEETFAPEALEIISSWIEARFKPAA